MRRQPSRASKTLFPEIGERDFEAKAIKGIGSWARSLCDKNMKIVSCSGELQTHELFRIANLVKTKKKINPPKKKNKKSTKKKGKRSLKKEKAMPVMKNSLSAVEKKCSIFRGFFSWTKKILFFFFSATQGDSLDNFETDPYLDHKFFSFLLCSNL